MYIKYLLFFHLKESVIKKKKKEISPFVFIVIKCRQSYSTFLLSPPFLSHKYEISFNMTVITVFFTVKINVPVNTVFFHPPYSKCKLCKTTAFLQFRPDAVNVSGMCGWLKSRTSHTLAFWCWLSASYETLPQWLWSSTTISYLLYFLPLSENHKPMSIPPAPSALLLHTSPHRKHVPQLLHFTTLASLSAPSAPGGAPQIGWGANRKAVVGRWKLVPFTRTCPASKHAFAQNEPLPFSRHQW